MNEEDVWINMERVKYLNKSVGCAENDVFIRKQRITNFPRLEIFLEEKNNEFVPNDFWSPTPLV